ncbi:MAG: ABC transporter permease [Rhodothermales bacterium]|nr:ABC transporter permease [Rhodothermales bacterium]MBO6778819.1 ABC transporter permease [Rhodothermales bacterium]
MDFRLLIARRYLLGRRSFSLITKITGISVAGVAVGVAALIVVLSVMNGFFTFVRDMLVSLDPHVRVVSAGERGFEARDSLLVAIEDVEGVVSASPYIEGKALLAYDSEDGFNKVVIVRGVDSDRDPTLGQAVASTGFGTNNLSRVEGRPGVVLGRRLGERLVLTPAGGDREASRVSLLSANALERTLTRVLGPPQIATFEVRGLYELEAVYDESFVFVDLAECQRMFRMGRRVHGVDVRLDDIEHAGRVQAALQESLDPDEFEVQTWYDLQESLYAVMRLEKWGAMAVLALIIVVAAFNIVGSLTMIVVEKRRDIGVLRAMGVSAADVRKIFLADGLLIGLFGGGIGLALGLGLSLLQQRYQFVPMMGADSFLIDSYPVSIELLDVAAISAMAIALCVLASVYPSTRAAKMEPARAVALDV